MGSKGEGVHDEEMERRSNERFHPNLITLLREAELSICGEMPVEERITARHLVLATGLDIHEALKSAEYYALQSNHPIDGSVDCLDSRYPIEKSEVNFKQIQRIVTEAQNESTIVHGKVKPAVCR